MDFTAHGDDDKFLAVALHGRLTHADYQMFVPEIEKQILKRGTVRLLVTMHDFHGWNALALWDGVKWNALHFYEIQRLAIVGENSWHKWMAAFCQLFTTASVRYFTPGQIDQAREWLNSSFSRVR